MPLDVRGRTRATMKAATCVHVPPKRIGEPAEPPSCQGSGLVIPSKRKSPARVDQVPAICTHRPSLLPIKSEALGLRPGLARHGAAPARRAVTGRREEGQT